MKGISNINVLQKEIESNENIWLLLYKKGSEQSDCALKNFIDAESIAKNQVLLNADVNVVRDIHPEYKITSVPTLLSFENGELKNVIKGCYQPEQLNAIFEKSSFIASSTGEGKPQKNVTVYSTPTCSWCTVIKRHLQENGIQYREIDVSADQKAAEEMVKKSGQQGVPQTDINGQVVVGFDKTRINSLLGIN
ncbi:MAG: glutathione S-transferase N-terminal domain-containing protein [Draconibacterium sp.]|nr:glutathione S-transferase N-terminal domain-containing protein [Draconibacterium sp.]